MRTQTNLGIKKPKLIKIGNVYCLFLGWFDEGRSPIITIGPDYDPYTYILILIVLVILCMFLYALKQTKVQAGLYYQYIMFALNVIVLFAGVIRNPGIPQ